MELDDSAQRALVAGYRAMLDIAERALHKIENDCDNADEMLKVAHDALDDLGVKA